MDGMPGRAMRAADFIAEFKALCHDRIVAGRSDSAGHAVTITGCGRSRRGGGCGEKDVSNLRRSVDGRALSEVASPTTAAGVAATEATVPAGRRVGCRRERAGRRRIDQYGKHDRRLERGQIAIPFVFLSVLACPVLVGH